MFLEVLTILGDTSHILYLEFEPLPSGRRYRVPKWRTVKASRSFVSNAVLSVNTYLKHKDKGVPCIFIVYEELDTVYARVLSWLCFVMFL